MSALLEFDVVAPAAAEAGELIVDLFAGGGGASLGIEWATGRSPDVAVNHDPDAVAMHRANHPSTLHLCANVWRVDPDEVVRRFGGRRVGLLWASPDCKHFSKAKGGRPVKRAIRDLAWVVVLWAKRARPRVICLENVEEFRDWGPLVERDGKWVPCGERRGQTFERWVADLRRLGYRVEWRELRASAYGVPTIRKRLFLIARCDGRPIVWPDASHGRPDSAEVREGRLLPWRTAAEDVIDWSIPCPSIFMSREEAQAYYEATGVRVNRPLAENTMARIAKGVKRYVLDAAEPFVVTMAHRHAPRGVGEPVRTLTASHDGHGLVVPVVTHGQQGGRSRPAEAPLHTVTASRKDTNAVIAPVVASLAHGESGGRRCYPAEEPVTTIHAGGGKQAVVAPYLVPRYGERPGQEPRTQPVTGPGPTVVPDGNGHRLAAVHMAKFRAGSDGGPVDAPGPTVTANSYVVRPGGAPPLGVVAAFLAQNNYSEPGHDAREPVSTLVAKGSTQAVVAAHLMTNTTGHPGGCAEGPVPTVATGGHHAVVAAGLCNMKGSDRRMSGPAEPGPTVCAQGGHVAEVRAFLAKYFAAAVGQDCREPLHTATGLPRFGLVTIAGEPYEIVDIGLRMLTRRELFRAQGFPDSYVIDLGLEEDGTWRPLSNAVSIRMAGNSVCPEMARVLVGANYALAVDRREVAS